MTRDEYFEAVEALVVGTPFEDLKVDLYEGAPYRLWGSEGLALYLTTDYGEFSFSFAVVDFNAGVYSRDPHKVLEALQGYLEGM